LRGKLTKPVIAILKTISETGDEIASTHGSNIYTEDGTADASQSVSCLSKTVIVNDYAKLLFRRQHSNYARPDIYAKPDVYAKQSDCA